MSYLNNLVIWVLCMTRFEICGQCCSRAGCRCQVPGVSVKTRYVDPLFVLECGGHATAVQLVDGALSCSINAAFVPKRWLTRA
jgi:hypothetical protein